MPAVPTLPLNAQTVSPSDKSPDDFSALSLKAHFIAVATLRDSIIDRMTDAERRGVAVDCSAAIKQLVTICRTVAPSAPYTDRQKRILAAFVKGLRSMPDLGRTIRDWPHMDSTRRLDFLNNCAGRLAALQSTPAIPVRAPPVRWATAPVMDQSKGVTIARPGDLAGTDDRIEIYPDNFDNSDDINEVMETLVHEQTHVYQIALIRAAMTGSIDRTHPLYGDAALFTFAMNREDIPIELGLPAYRAQCLEWDAYRAGRFARYFMMKADRDGPTALPGYLLHLTDIFAIIRNRISLDGMCNRNDGTIGTNRHDGRAGTDTPPIP